MGKIQDAVAWAIQIANDDRYGYSKQSRWGEQFTFDCSSFVISAFQQAGIPVRQAGALNTFTMREAFLKCGFSDIKNQVNCATGTGMQLGDVLLREDSHTCLFIGNSRVANASSPENGIRIQNYYDGGWNCVLRYSESSAKQAITAETSDNTNDTEYIVKKGDTLWGLAERYLGSGLRYYDLVTWNGLKSSALYVGQRLTLKPTAEPPKAEEPKEVTSGDTYTVASGDTLWGLAERYLGSGLRYVEIKKLNNLSSDAIYVGQKLKLP